MRTKNSKDYQDGYDLGYKNGYVDGAKDYQPKKGEWIMNNLTIEEWMCSVCHEKFDNIPTCMGEPLYSFCPDCGADLRGDV